MDYQRLEEIFATTDEIKYWQAYLFVYCVENDIDVDTKRYDELVYDLYDVAHESWIDFNLSFDAFYNIVSKFLV